MEHIIKKKKLFFLFVFLSSVTILLFVRTLTANSIIDDLTSESADTLIIQSLNAQIYTEKYGVTASMLSRRSDIKHFIQQPLVIRELLRQNIMRVLNHTNALSGSNRIWLVNSEGRVLLQSDNTGTASDFLAENIDEEDYFQTAMQGRLGRANLKIGNHYSYLFAAPVFKDNQVIGTTIILVALDTLEQIWALNPDPIIAVDKNKNILVSNVKNWRLTTFKSNEGKSSRSKESFIQFGKSQKMVTLNIAVSKDKIKRYIVNEKFIPLLDWNLIILQDRQKVIKQVNNSTLITLLALLLFWLTIWFLWNKNARAKEERRQQIEFANLLEDRVKRRTKAVSIANTKLEKEVEERKATEQELRKTQKELIQSAKMASIGQMSTILAHEYNQPISAIQFYAINSRILIKNKQNDEAADNMDRIEQLTQRMAGLTTSLRNFAHKPSQQLKKVRISNVVDQLTILMQPLLAAKNVELIIDPPEEELIVKAGSTRLTQILSNLISNSIDALKNTTDKQITLQWRANESQAVEIIIKDNGPGIPPNEREKLYDAFYTTKSNQDGLGLGLFIVYNLINELSGKLTILDEAKYGAVFCIELERQTED